MFCLSEANYIFVRGSNKTHVARGLVNKYFVIPMYNLRVSIDTHLSEDYL